MRLSRSLIVRLAILLVLGGVAVVLGIRAASRVAKFRAVDRVCDAADRGQWDTVLRQSGPLVGADPEGLRAAECRCTALLETGDQKSCVDLLEGLLERPATEDWLPQPMMTGLLVASREERGSVIEAAELAHRGASRYPESSVLQVQELVLRSRTEDEGSVLEEMRRRLERSEALSRADSRAGDVLALRMAQRHVARDEWHEALELLGDDPDRFPPDLENLWFRVYTTVLAGLGRQDDLEEAFDRWRQRGADPLEVEARHALLLSLHQIPSRRDKPLLSWLVRIVEQGREMENRDLLRAVYIRLIGSLVVTDHHEAALRYYEEASEEFEDLGFVTREDILRSETLATLGEEVLTSLHGTILFRVPDPRAGDTLLVSPDVDRPVDEPYRTLEVPSDGALRVGRRIGTWPQRWVLRDGDGAVVGSGAVWPTPESTVQVRIERGSTGQSSASETPAPVRPPDARRPADGRRRVIQVILDCADWRIVQYGRARGEMPFFDRLVTDGRRAVVESIPAFTSAAITKLVYPTKEGLRSLFDLMHQIGGEIQGLNFVGVNPFGALETVLPAEERLFETFAEDGLAAVNLLRSHGSLQVGRQAQVLGPGDRVRKLSGYRSSRPLTETESLLIGETEEESRGHLEEMAADFDFLERLVDEEEVDFIALRVASLDLLTHGLFKTLNRTGQDDGEALLYRTYRYMDRRLGMLEGHLDADDVLIVMSDHGIRTPMEHDERSLFVAAGRGVEPGRIPGSPPIRKVTGWVADLLDVETAWPGSGEVDWSARDRPSAPAEEAP